MTQTVTYPYLPKEGTIQYVPSTNRFMQAAKAHAREHSLDRVMPNASIIVKDEDIIGRGANGSDYHDTHICERIRQGIPTGQGYELCEGCHPKNHSEPKAITDAQVAASSHTSLKGAALYLWGHWWCCKPCWTSMLASGIRTVYLLENSEILFNKQAPGNIVGHQFIA
jgi:deoxycytidylate deaminase